MRPREESQVHTRLLRFTLGIDESRAYWDQVDPTDVSPIIARAYEKHWFGIKSQARVETTIANMRARYDTFPDALEVLRGWGTMPPDTRRVICHWHLQLSDPIYRDFTGRFLKARRGSLRAEIDRDLVVQWVEDAQPGRWAVSTRIMWASKLLSTAYGAHLVGSTQDPRPLRYPKVPDEALSYVLHLLRGVGIDGTMVDNPYLASVGLSGSFLEDRLRSLPGITYQRMGDLIDFDFDAPDLRTWGEATP